MEKCSSSSAASTDISTSDNYDEKDSQTSKMKAALFLAGLSGMSIFGGFSYAVAAAKKTDPSMFDQGIRGTKTLPMAGSTLALRALGWGSLYAVSGVSVLSYLIWKISGAQDMNEFRYKVGSVLPKIYKNVNSDERTEFESVADLLQYIFDSEERKKKISVRETDCKKQN